MAEERACENGRISNFEGLVTLTLTLDLVTLHTVVHHSSTSTYMRNFIELEETLSGQTDGRIHGRKFETDFRSVDPINSMAFTIQMALLSSS